LKRFLSICGRGIDIAERISNLGSGWLIIFIILLILSDVSCRFFVSKSIAGAYNLAEIIMVGICFLPMAYTQREKGHVAVDFLVLRLKERPRQAMEMVSTFLSFVISILLFYRSAAEAKIAVDLLLTTSGIVKWPAWPLKILVAFGFFLLCIRIAIQLSQQMRLIIRGREHHAF